MTAGGSCPCHPFTCWFETTDHDEAGEYLTGIYGDVHLGIGRKSAPVRRSRLITGTFSFVTAFHTTEIGYTMESAPTLLIARPRTAPVHYRYGAAEHYFPGEVHLSNTIEDHPPIQARWHNGAVQAVTFPFALLDQVAAPSELATRSLSASPACAPPAPLVTAAAGRMLAAATLNAFPNTR